MARYIGRLKTLEQIKEEEGPDYRNISPTINESMEKYFGKIHENIEYPAIGFPKFYQIDAWFYYDYRWFKWITKDVRVDNSEINLQIESIINEIINEIVENI